MHASIEVPSSDGLSALEMRPRLRDDVCFAPAPDGALVVMPSRPDMGFRVPGRGAYDWLRRLTPFLSGDHTIRDLGRSLEQDRMIRMRSLIARLAREGAVRDAAADRPHTLSGEVRRRYARQIAFIGCEIDSPENRFQRFRDSAPIVVGCGRLLLALVHGLCTAGVARVRVVLADEQPTNLLRLEEVLKATLGPDGDRDLEIISEDCLRDLSSAATAGVLHVSEEPALSRMAALALACREHRLLFGQATIVGLSGLVGPVANVGGQAPRMEAAWFERIWRGVACPGGDRLDVPAGDYLTGPASALVANHLCAAFLREMTGLPNAVANGFVEVDLETFQTAVHSISGPADAEQEMKS
jgi:hypothetical protein